MFFHRQAAWPKLQKALIYYELLVVDNRSYLVPSTPGFDIVRNLKWEV